MTTYKLKTPIRIRLEQALWKLRFALFPSAKRSIDIVISLMGLVLISPILLTIAVLIKLESKGPAFFQQERIGLDGEPFTMFKFRSMKVDAEQCRSELENSNEMASGVIFKMKRDPRITRIGSFIRKTSIDELPQLINVLRGDMTLVGPRPPLAAEVAQYSRADRARLSVVPGITCFWQISGRSDIPFDKQVQLDVRYIERQSIRLDILVLLRTIPAVLKARGAY